MDREHLRRSFCDHDLHSHNPFHLVVFSERTQSNKAFERDFEIHAERCFQSGSRLTLRTRPPYRLLLCSSESLIR